MAGGVNARGRYARIAAMRSDGALFPHLLAFRSSPWTIATVAVAFFGPGFAGAAAVFRVAPAACSVSAGSLRLPGQALEDVTRDELTWRWSRCSGPLPLPRWPWEVPPCKFVVAVFSSWRAPPPLPLSCCNAFPRSIIRAVRCASSSRSLRAARPTSSAGSRRRSFPSAWAGSSMWRTSAAPAATSPRRRSRGRHPTATRSSLPSAPSSPTRRSWARRPTTRSRISGRSRFRSLRQSRSSSIRRCRRARSRSLSCSLPPIPGSTPTHRGAPGCSRTSHSSGSVSRSASTSCTFPSPGRGRRSPP